VVVRDGDSWRLAYPRETIEHLLPSARAVA